MPEPEQINADQRAFWDGHGGTTWVARQEHTDIILAPVSEALLAHAAPRPGEEVLDVGCGCALRPFAKRWHPTWTERACTSLLRCGW